MSDVVIRNGTILDGTGLPRFRADVEVRSGMIQRVGRDLAAPAGTLEVDASNLLVCPGFIDIHTHYDAQLHFEPTVSPSSWHGVTTVFVGNCGFSLAPSRHEDVDWLLQMLSRVEGMPIEALRAGVDFAGGTVGDFMSGLDGRVGVNVCTYVGHCAVRRFVMGPAASERAATSEEIEQMQHAVRLALAEGAVGFSTSQLDVHADHEGRPVPSNLASPEEMVALARVLGEFDHGVIEFLSRSFPVGYDDDDRALLREMAAVSGKPMHLAVLERRRGPDPERWRSDAEFVLHAQQDGLRLYPMYNVNPKGLYFTLADTFIFDEIPSMREVLTKPGAIRDALLRDVATRDLIRRQLTDGTKRGIDPDWTLMRVVESKSRPDLQGRTVADIAGREGADSLDVLLDVSLSDHLDALFVLEKPYDALVPTATATIMKMQGTMAGSSDGGAHLQTFCGADYTTRHLLESVPDPFTLEQAVASLTMEPAVAHGMWDRGVIRVGAKADLLLLDPDSLGCGPPRFISDFPAGAQRLVIDSTGYQAVFVNGTLVRDREEWTGALPGEMLRFGTREGAPA
jgi:N-acyl-D-aspartate/D-glutamate deacylase